MLLCSPILSPSPFVPYFLLHSHRYFKIITFDHWEIHMTFEKSNSERLKLDRDQFNNLERIKVEIPVSN